MASLSGLFNHTQRKDQLKSYKGGCANPNNLHKWISAQQRLKGVSALNEIWAKVGDARSGGIVKLADAVAELNPLDDFGQAVLTIEFAPFLVR